MLSCSELIELSCDCGGCCDEHQNQFVPSPPPPLPGVWDGHGNTTTTLFLEGVPYSGPVFFASVGLGVAALFNCLLCFCCIGVCDRPRSRLGVHACYCMVWCLVAAVGGTVLWRVFMAPLYDGHELGLHVIVLVEGLLGLVLTCLTGAWVCGYWPWLHGIADSEGQGSSNGGGALKTATSTMQTM